jgi:putative transposase
MSTDLRKGSHTVGRLTCHVVWVAKYRFKVLNGDAQKRCCELLIQIFEAKEIDILKGVVSLDYVYIHIEYVPKQNISSILESFKERTSRKIQMEFLELKAKYRGQHFWASVTVLGVLEIVLIGCSLNI